MPGFWMNETSGVLRPAVEAYLQGDEITPAEVAAMRAYLRQWIEGDGFQGEDVEELRRQIDGLTDRQSITAWLDKALDAGIDPL